MYANVHCYLRKKPIMRARYSGLAVYVAEPGSSKSPPRYKIRPHLGRTVVDADGSSSPSRPEIP